MVQDLGSEADRALLARETLALTFAAEGDTDRALAEYAAVSDVRTRRYPPHHRERIDGEDRLAIAAFEAGDAARARAVQQGAQDLRKAGLLCVPEDHTCKHSSHHHCGFCSECQVPVCRACQLCSSHNMRSPVSLAHDSWFGYVQGWVYEQEVI